MSDRLLDFPPDLYTRYFLTFELLEHAFDGERISVLDVGGQNGLLKRFIEEKGRPYKLTILDILPSSDGRKGYFQGDIYKAPFRDGEFDVVVCCDVLEHIKDERKSGAVLEMLRLSRDLVILTAPFETKEVREAERLANEFFRKYTHKDHPWLKEHFLVKLPETGRIESLLKKKGYYLQSFGSNNLFNWLLFTLANFMPSFFQIDITKLRDINRFYNLNFLSLGDFDPPTYRRIYFIGRDKSRVDKLQKSGIAFQSKLDPTKKLIFEQMICDFLVGESAERGEKLAPRRGSRDPRIDSKLDKCLRRLRKLIG